MNYLQLVQQLRLETNYANTGPTTVSGQTGDHARACSWITQAYVQLQNRHLWRWLRKGFTLPVLSGVDTYDYTSAIDSTTTVAISRFKAWRLSDRFNPPKIYLTSGGLGGEYFLTYIPWDSFCMIYRIGTRQTGAPAHITVDPADNIVLGPEPSDTYVVTSEYHKGAQVLTDSTDTPELPTDYHMLIVYMAMEDSGLFDSADEVLVRADRKRARLMRQLEAQQAPKIMSAGPMV